MKFSCEKGDLLGAINCVSGAVAAKSQTPALEGIYIKAENGELTLTGYNLDIGITAKLTAGISEDGEIVVPSKLFKDIVSKMANDTVFVSEEKLTVNIKCGGSKFKIIGLDGHDYPSLPEVETDNSFPIEQSLLNSMISDTVYAVSDSATRPVHAGCKFTVTPGHLEVAAVDSFRLAIRQEPIESESSFSFVVPGTSLKEVTKSVPNTGDTINVTVSKTHAIFSTDDFTIITRTLEGAFLDYRKVLPTEASIKVDVNVKRFSGCVERVALVISDKYKSSIKAEFGDGQVQMSAATSNGAANDGVDITGDGQNLVIGFNHRYMLEALKNSPCDDMTFEMNDAGKPIIMKPTDPLDNSILLMIMPIRLS